MARDEGRRQPSGMLERPARLGSYSTAARTAVKQFERLAEAARSGSVLFGTLRFPSCPMNSNILAFPGMKTVWGRLVSVISAMCVLSCSVFTSTPMLGHEHCRNLPSVEDCQGTASRLITDHCLRTCIIEKCSKAEPLCDATAVAQCAELSRGHLQGQTGGFVLPGPQTCRVPANEIFWCQIEQSPRCQEQSMVHELAHLCGWKHGEGQGVPGDDQGEFRCR
jgi:hypothetical protein